MTLGTQTFTHRNIKMNDQFFNGSGSRFNARFGSGEEITAKQLNDLAGGVQAGLPMPYLGEGPSVSFTPGGAVITQSSQLPLPPVIDYPFRITAFVTQGSDPDYFLCTPGTLNSLCPGYDGNNGTSLTELPRPEIPLVFDSTGDGGVSYIYLSAGPNETNTYTFPDNNFYANGYPDVSSYSSVQTDDDDFGNVMLAKITRIVENGVASCKIDQYVQSSLWSERRKYSEPDTATYYFWRA